MFDEGKEWCWTEQAVDDKVGEFTIVQRRWDDVTTDVEASDTTNVNEDIDECDEEVFEDGDSDDNIQPRRSTRPTTRPTYLDDYILIAEVGSERLLMIVNEEPWDYNEAKELEV